MTGGVARRRLGAGQLVLVLPPLALLAMALWFQLEGAAARIAALAALGLGALALLRLWWVGRGLRFWTVAGAILLVSGVWWSTIRPTNDADWQPDVAHGVTADVVGNEVTLYNVRNFDWITPTGFTPRWETRRYRLDELTGVDLYTSVWGNPKIAHVMVGFGFADGRHVVFSAETRKTTGQVYSTLGGFFRLYELVLIAADERDIIRLRTDVRDAPPETVSLFPLQMTPERREQLFLEYLTLGDTLALRPEFYNTATTNCTTVVWKLARALAPGIPLDRRVLLSGLFPDYLHDLGVLGRGQDLPAVLREARLAPVGPAGPDEVAFSARLRAGRKP